MNINDIITAFKLHQLQYGLNGDSGQEELYKWEIVTKQSGHPNTDADDFAKEINSLDFINLWYPPQKTAIRQFAKYEPEEYRAAIKRLFDEKVNLQQRIEAFVSTCKSLWNEKIKRHFGKNTSARCDERLISCFLTLLNPQKYTFYKSNVYDELCDVLGIKKKKTGQKLVHFYELLEKYVIPIVEKDKELMDSVNEELQKEGYIHSLPLIAQTALWIYINRKSDKQITKGKNESPMKYQPYIELLEKTHNLVLTGAPGTGKTYMAQKIAEEMGCTKEEMSFVQFHPSYDYTDFVEGLRPVEKNDGQMGFERVDGVFKEFCKKAVKNCNDFQKSIESLTKELSWEEKIQQFVEDAVENNTTFKLSNGNEFTIDGIKGRTIIVHNEKNEKTSQVYVNADEVMDLLVKNVRLSIVRDIRNHFNRKFGTQPDSYAFILTKEIRKMKTVISNTSATKIERRPFVFIIDEINRGEASKIFGELFYAIDPGYRGKTDVRVKTQYQNLIPESDVFADGFYVPENVYILATMNDIDRSVESMDFAMRRRFTWKEITPADTQSMLDGLECAEAAKATMKRLNDVIAETEGLGAAYEVGPSYFLKLGANGGNLAELWKMNIEPLLREYLRGFRKAEDILVKLKDAYYGRNTNASETESIG